LPDYPSRNHIERDGPAARFARNSNIGSRHASTLCRESKTIQGIAENDIKPPTKLNFSSSSTGPPQLQR
jgi:hypothetical protein